MLCTSLPRDMSLLYLAVVASLVGLAWGCGQRPASMRIINGDEAAPHSWPWQVSIRVNRRHHCGAALIRPDWVLTAAHCVKSDPSPSRYKVVLGAHRRSKKTSVEQYLDVTKVIMHPRYARLTHDLALMKLERPVSLTSKINTVCLPNDDVEVGKECYITGWGRTENGFPDILQQAMLPIANSKDCRRQHGAFRNAHLCAGEAREGASGGCRGDSGGPLVCEENGRWVLHGAVSFGRSNQCPVTYYTVFTRVNTYMDWILSKIDGGGGGGEGPNTAPPGTANPSTCSDSSSGCKGFKKWCRSPEIQRICPHTCNRC